MRTRAEKRVPARYRLDRLKVSFWFAPALMTLDALLLIFSGLVRRPLLEYTVDVSRTSGDKLPGAPGMPRLVQIVIIK